MQSFSCWTGVIDNMNIKDIGNVTSLLLLLNSVSLGLRSLIHHVFEWFNLCFTAFSQEWSYDEASPIGPSKWGQVSALCSGSMQSPVNLGWLNATIMSVPQKLTIENIDKLPNSIEYNNDGHGISVGFTFNDGVRPQISGGPLTSTYIFYGLHWHWKSEHQIDSREFDAELHMIHYNSKYGSFEAAEQHPDGLAVLSLLYFTGQGLIESAISVNNTAETRPFIGLIEKVLKPGKKYIETKSTFSLFEILGFHTFSYLNYRGSLTTPSKTLKKIILGF